MVAELGVLIPIIALCIPIMAIWTRHRQRIAAMEVEAAAQLSAEKAAQYATRFKTLEDRVRVLERIVTDKGLGLASQIEALRDIAPADAPEPTEKAKIQ